MTIAAAGVLIIASDGKALFLKRGPKCPSPGTWCFPGGGIESGESALDAALRETEEETGCRLKADDLALWARRIAENEDGEIVDFTTFIARNIEPFAPQLGPKDAPESVAYAWAPPDQPPEPLHPGCRIALAKIGMDELGIARAIAAGELTSPQRYENVTLFDIRITGIGASYRRALDEFVWRDPSIYLNDEFLARCNGLPVIWEHPPGELDSKEFAARIVGTIFVPYLKNNEVWGVAKIFDATAVEMLTNEQLSTSPMVVLAEAESEKLKLEDGSTLLVEGKPSLLDHLAICELGVWDKGGPPTGVSSTGVEDMPEEKAGEEHREDHGRADAAVHEKLDKIMGRLDSAHTRLDALETRRKDAESEAEREEKEAEKGNAQHRHDAEEDERKFADALKRGDKKKKAAVEGFEAGGVFHPIRGSSGYSKRKAGDSDETHRARHDAEEEDERNALEEAGMEKGRAADAARRHRRDAEKEEEREPEPREDHDGDEQEDRGRRDAKRRDAEHEKEEGEDEREDSARRRGDSALARENADLKARIAKVEGTMRDITRETPAAERDALAAAQSRADGVAAMFGDRVPPPNVGETPLGYRRRLAQRFQRHSPQFKDSRLDSADSATLAAVENQIYADAQTAARSVAGAQPGILIPFIERDMAGRQITRYHGDIMAWMQHYMTGAQVGRINRNPKGA